MAKNKKDNVQFLTGLIIAGVFVLAAILFMMTQYQYKLLGTIDIGGFRIAFGKDNDKGYFLFALPFFFAIIGAAAAVLAALKIIKVKGSAIYSLCAVLALVSIIAYIVTIIHIKDKHTIAGKDFSDLVKYTFAFWAGFIMHIIAFLGSAYAAYNNRK